MDRRTMLKNAAVLTVAPVALLSSTAAAMADAEHPEIKAKRLAEELSVALDNYREGDWYAVVHARSTGKGGGFERSLAIDRDVPTPLRRAYDRYRVAFEAIYGKEADDDMMELNYTPSHAELDIATLAFWNTACRTMEEVAEKTRLVEETSDLSHDIKHCGRYIGHLDHGYHVGDLFFASLRGEETDLEAYFEEIRSVYAERLPADLEKLRLDNLRRQEATKKRALEETKKAEHAARAMHPEQARLSHQFRESMKALFDWQDANPELTV